MKACFVVQGYGKKTDYTDGRVLDLDASYAIIKDAVEAAGLSCIRADEIHHSGTIDVPMYEQLLRADLVIADLSTYNVNAAFELGVRYALRPHATIIVAEEQFKNPFDFSHIVIRRYRHLGEDLGVKEARRFRDELKQAIEAIRDRAEVDSPVYTFLPHLQPPLDRQMQELARKLETVLDAAGPAPPPASVPDAVADAVTTEADAGTLNAKQLLESANRLIDASDFAAARLLLEEAQRRRPHDTFITQRLALAIYKSGQPDAGTALKAAREVMRALHPDTTNNPETLGLWGAIHKRLWDLDPSPELLDVSISAYARGFALKQDHYNGINFALLLDLRALQALTAGEHDEAVADHVLAQRVRRDVSGYAMQHLERLGDEPSQERFWIMASLWEAALGLGESATMTHWEAEMTTMAVPAWMRQSMQEQGAKLHRLLSDYEALAGRAPLHVEPTQR